MGEACLPSNAYYPGTPDYTLYSGVYVCWSEHSDSSFVCGFMSLDYGLGTMTSTTFSTIFCYLLLDFHVKAGIRFSLRDERLFVISKVITKIYLYNFDQLKPHFYKAKLGFTGVYINFLISAQKHRLWVFVKTVPPRRF